MVSVWIKGDVVVLLSQSMPFAMDCCISGWRREPKMLCAVLWRDEVSAARAMVANRVRDIIRESEFIDVVSLNKSSVKLAIYSQFLLSLWRK